MELLALVHIACLLAVEKDGMVWVHRSELHAPKSKNASRMMLAVHRKITLLSRARYTPEVTVCQEPKWEKAIFLRWSLSAIADFMASSGTGRLVAAMEMPEVLTHRYDPSRGACLNLCSLSDLEASRVLDRLRRESRPKLKSNYLGRRRVTEEWLGKAASEVLGRAMGHPPIYFFLGDFSYMADPSRPAALVIPVSCLRVDAVTFTLGDSMSVAEEQGRRVYTLQEMVGLFAEGEGEAVAGFGFCDEAGVQARFIEVQVWEKVVLPAGTAA
jgi:hypothetical protein